MWQKQSNSEKQRHTEHRRNRVTQRDRWVASLWTLVSWRGKSPWPPLLVTSLTSPLWVQGTKWVAPVSTWPTKEKLFWYAHAYVYIFIWIYLFITFIPPLPLFLSHCWVSCVKHWRIYLSQRRIKQQNYTLERERENTPKKLDDSKSSDFWSQVYGKGRPWLHFMALCCYGLFLKKISLQFTVVSSYFDANWFIFHYFR